MSSSVWNPYLLAAYAVVLLSVAAYAWRLHVRTTALRRRRGD